VFLGHCINQRQPEIADETGNIYNAETVTDSIDDFDGKSGIRPWRAREKCRKLIATATDNRK